MARPVFFITVLILEKMSSYSERGIGTYKSLINKYCDEEKWFGHTTLIVMQLVDIKTSHDSSSYHYYNNNTLFGIVKFNGIL